MKKVYAVCVFFTLNRSLFPSIDIYLLQQQQNSMNHIYSLDYIQGQTDSRTKILLQRTQPSVSGDRRNPSYCTNLQIQQYYNYCSTAVSD